MYQPSRLVDPFPVGHCGSRSSLDCECGREIHFVGRQLAYLADSRERRSLPQQLVQPLQRTRITLRAHVHRSIGQVAHPAAEPELARPPLRPRPKPDALNAASYQEPTPARARRSGFIRHLTTIFQFASVRSLEDGGPDGKVHQE